MEGNDESLYCHDNLIIPLIKRGMMSDYAHVNHASVSVNYHLLAPPPQILEIMICDRYKVLSRLKLFRD